MPVKIKNETLVAKKFIQAMDRIGSYVWGVEIDKKLYAIIAEVYEKQTMVNSLHKKYVEEAKASSEDPVEQEKRFLENWQKLAEEEQELSLEEPLELSASAERRPVSPMEAFVVRSVFKITFIKEKG